MVQQGVISLLHNEKRRRGDTDVTTDGNVSKTSWYVTNAWRAGQEPEAIREALRMGEHVIGLIIQAATLIKEACHTVYPIIEDAAVRCQMIVDQLMREIVRLAPILARLQAGSRAVAS
jgi:hypothetical protein